MFCDRCLKQTHTHKVQNVISVVTQTERLRQEMIVEFVTHTHTHTCVCVSGVSLTYEILTVAQHRNIV